MPRIPHPTHGGFKGHLFRRAVHVAMLLIPWVYYPISPYAAHTLRINITQFTLLVLLLILLLEAVRLQCGGLWFGHREHERHRISSFTWGSVAIAMTLLLVPGGYPTGQGYATAIITSTALADPWLGETRHFGLPRWVQLSGGLAMVGLIWLGAAALFHFNAWYALIMAPITIASEHAEMGIIDDNAFMTLMPLLAIWIVRSFP